MSRLSNKVSLVTGAASGIGQAVAHTLAAEGAMSIVADIDFAAALEVVKEIAHEGGRAKAIQLDVSDESSWKGRNRK